jgi:hypothetical protein
MGGNGTNGRVYTRDLDARLRAVEEQIGGLAEKLMSLEQAHQAAHINGAAASEKGGTEGKIAELEALVTRLDQRVDKITQTLVAQQASGRWS